MKQFEETKYNTYWITADGRVFIFNKRSKKLKPVKPIRAGNQHTPYDNRYQQVICGGKRQHYYIHQLVYRYYVGNIPEGMTVDHIDNDKNNNHYSNLQLLTRSDNTKKSWEVRRNRTNV